MVCNAAFILSRRSIVWLQTQRDVTVERQRMPSLSPRREDNHEFRVGRLKHERIKVPRNEELLAWARQAMKTHADRKSILEVRSCSFEVCIFYVSNLLSNHDDFFRLSLSANKVQDLDQRWNFTH